jgi:ATP-binding cassette, subfamily C, bacterial CydD
MNLNRRLLDTGKTIWPWLGLAILAGFLAGLATIWQASQISRVVTGAFLEGVGLSASLPALWALLGAVGARAGLVFASEWAASTAAIQVKEQLRETILRRLVALGPAYLEGERSGTLNNTLTQGIEALDAYFSQYLPQLALAGLLPLAYLVVILPRDPLSGIGLLLTGPLIPFFMFLIGSTAHSLTRTQWTALGKMSAYFLDTLQGLIHAQSARPQPGTGRADCTGQRALPRDDHGRAARDLPVGAGAGTTQYDWHGDCGGRDWPAPAVRYDGF